MRQVPQRAGDFLEPAIGCQAVRLPTPVTVTFAVASPEPATNPASAGWVARTVQVPTLLRAPSGSSNVPSAATGTLRSGCQAPVPKRCSTVSGVVEPAGAILPRSVIVPPGGTATGDSSVGAKNDVCSNGRTP